MNSRAMMGAIRIQKFGGPEVLHLESVAVPTPGKGELLVKVAAAKAVRTWPPSVRSLTWAR
jgi:NADPH:quinone reductase-like Zn-dependent oxidoreductase